MWPDVEFFKLNREPADVDRVSVALEVAEDRGPFCGCGDGRSRRMKTFAIADQIVGSPFPAEGFRNLICNPFCGRMRCDAGPYDLSSAVPHDQQSIELPTSCSKRGCRERNFWMQRQSAKIATKMRETSAETKLQEVSGRKSPQKRPIRSRIGNVRGL